MIDNVTFALKCLFCSVYSIGVFLSISVSVQVAQGLTVRKLDLGGVVDWRADKLKHRFPHVCRHKIQETLLFIDRHNWTFAAYSLFFASPALYCVTH